MGLLHAWASTLPHIDGRTPRVGDPCAVEGCPERLREDEECYRVIERADDRWVCWRHVEREGDQEPYPVVADDEDGD
jgi:hypothetical protein